MVVYPYDALFCTRDHGTVMGTSPAESSATLYKTVRPRNTNFRLTLLIEKSASYGRENKVLGCRFF